MSANDIQHGGDHYRDDETSVQHWDICDAYEVPYLESAASKYVYRWRKKAGVLDLQKAEHYLQKRMENVGPYLSAGKVSETEAENFCEQHGLDDDETEAVYTLWTWTSLADLEVALAAIRRLIASAA